MNVQHSSNTQEHYTPPEYIEAARAVMGSIDLDPATTPEVNARIVRAEKFFTKADDGLKQDWEASRRRASVWLNPPGGKTAGKSNATIWWDKLVSEYLHGHVEQAIFLGFSVEILATAQRSLLWPGAYPFCIPRKRISFLKSDFSPGESPTHANIIVYLPPIHALSWERNLSVEEFYKAFSRFGKVRV